MASTDMPARKFAILQQRNVSASQQQGRLRMHTHTQDLTSLPPSLMTSPLKEEAVELSAAAAGPPPAAGLLLLLAKGS